MGRIAIVKVKLTDSPEAIDVLRKIYENRKRNNDIDLKFARKVLIEAYQNNKKYKIADSLIAEGTNEAKETLNDEFMYYMKFLQANSYFLQSNFERSKSSIEESLLYATELKNDEFINESNYLIAKVLLKENKYQEAKKIIKQAIYNSSNK